MKTEIVVNGQIYAEELLHRVFYTSAVIMAK